MPKKYPEKNFADLKKPQTVFTENCYTLTTQLHGCPKYYYTLYNKKVDQIRLL